LLWRLGLRAAEVSALSLDDIDWRDGVIVVHGKGNRHDPLPLPVDVGDAVAAYLRRGRPAVGSRAVFVTTSAPIRPLSLKNSSDLAG
jgi:site-specific recombinase XerD